MGTLLRLQALTGYQTHLWDGAGYTLRDRHLLSAAAMFLRRGTRSRGLPSFF